MEGTKDASLCPGGSLSRNGPFCVFPLVFRILTPIQVAPGSAGMLCLHLLFLICRPAALCFFLEQAQGSPGLDDGL